MLVRFAPKSTTDDQSRVICSMRCGKHCPFMINVGANYRHIMDRIASAALSAGRNPHEVRLLAAAKSQTVMAVRAAISAGVTLIGENYVQEAAEKKRQLSNSVEWHMIGHLQRNKAKAAVEVFDLIESLDSL